MECRYLCTGQNQWDAMRFAITGLLAATHTSFSPSGDLNLALA